MPRQTDSQRKQTTKKEWYADDLEMECMSEDDFEMDDVLDDEGEEILEDETPGTNGNVPVWRLIEMSRENRFLQREIADFEDYDTVFDDYTDSYAH